MDKLEKVIEELKKDIKRKEMTLKDFEEKYPKKKIKRIRGKFKLQKKAIDIIKRVDKKKIRKVIKKADKANRLGAIELDIVPKAIYNYLLGEEIK